MATVNISDFGKGTIYSVSRGTGYSVKDIIAANPGIDINNIAPNATINLPNTVMESVNIDDYGSIYSISQKTGIPVDDIIASNSGIDINSIPSGASINLPRGNVIPAPQSALEIVNIDDYGSIYSISQKTGVPVDDIVAANPNIDVNNISTGTKINVPSKNISLKKPPAVTKPKPPTLKQEAYEQKVEEKRENEVGNEPKKNCKCKKNKDGFIDKISTDIKVVKKHIKKAEHGTLKKINAIVIHRTAGSKLSFSNAKNNGIAAHFYVDKDGTIYQVASLNKVCYHVGKIKSKAKEEGSLTNFDKEYFKKIGWSPSKEYKYEKNKKYPTRYPYNYDSIGIETVGSYNKTTKTWEHLTEAQKKSVSKLYNCLIKLLKLDKNSDTYTHEQISRKTKGEGQTVLDAISGMI